MPDQPRKKFDWGSISTVESLAKFPDEAPYPILRVGLDGRLLYANAPSTPLLAHWSAVVGDVVPEEIRKTLEKAVAQTRTIEVEQEVGGREYVLTVTPIADAPYLNLYGRDVTDHRLAEKWVRDLARFPDENPNPVLRIDRQGTVVYANGAAEVLLRHWKLDEDNRVPEALQARIIQAIELDEPFELEEETDDGTLRLGMAPIPSGGYLNVYGRNITRQREAEGELVAARDQALAASRAKSAFLANMSHELRTPMNAIIGYSEMLIEEADEMDGAEMLADLQKVHGAGRHLLNLINDILDLSKIEAGRMDLYLEDVVIRDVVGQVVDTVLPLMKQNGNELMVDFADAVSEMHTDPTKLRQNLLNLLSNAAKFTHDGTVRLEVSQGAENVHFAVKDTGIGMDAEQLSRVFLSFTQADVSTTRRYGGTGLGLTITRHYCEMLGGSIEVESVEGEGSTFTLVLPERSGKRASSSRQAGRSSSSIRLDGFGPAGRVVLVVDDDPEVQEILRATLGGAGFSVICAHNGEEGVRLARELSPVAITLDVMMRGTDGWGELTDLKSDDKTRDIPIILVTISDEKNLGMALGAAEFITKPIDKGRLLDVLETYRANDPSPQVLVVEDDEDLRSLVRRTLSKHGWTVTEAAHGGEGLAALEESIPRIVLLDLMMPVVDGFEFLARVRADERYQDLPIVVVTAKELDEVDRERLDGHVARVLEKGEYTRDQLLEVIRDLVNASTGNVRALIPR